jgi:hypothetical protein
MLVVFVNATSSARQIHVRKATTAVQLSPSLKAEDFQEAAGLHPFRAVRERPHVVQTDERGQTRFRDTLTLTLSLKGAGQLDTLTFFLKRDS